MRRPFCLFLERTVSMHFLTLTAVQIPDMEVNLLPGLGRFFGQLPVRPFTGGCAGSCGLPYLKLGVDFTKAMVYTMYIQRWVKGAS